jgi:exosortase
VGILKGTGAIIGMEVVRKGTQFTINGNPFDVAPACSGLRSLVALSAIGAAYAFITQPGVLRKWLLGICAVPIALITNMVRLVMVGITCHFFGPKAAMHVHDSSIFLYILAILFLFSLDRIFSRVWRSEWIRARLRWLKTRDF